MATGSVVEWRIENFSHWCAEVHGHCIQSPNFHNPLFSNMDLYPRGINGTGEHLVVHLCGWKDSRSGELSFHSSDGSLLCSKQRVKVEENIDVLELPPGPKFQDVLSRIREDFITLRCRKKNRSIYERCMCTTINVLKISLEINSRWIEKMKSNEKKSVCNINFSSRLYDGIELFTCSENNAVRFMISPPTSFEDPFAVEMLVRLTGSDGTVDSRVMKKEHVFRDKSEWTFPDPLQKRESAGKGICLFLCLKTKNVIQSPFYANWDYRYINIEINNTLWISEKAQSTEPVTFNKVTKDSAMPDDSVQVLSKELMCLYQVQDLSDVTLKCDNVSFPVHKNILSARSPVFKTMLSCDMREAAISEVDIGDLDPSTLSIFLTYLYTGAVEEEPKCDRVLKLYNAAAQYQVSSLKRDCSRFLRSNVSILNVCDILTLADRHRDVKLTAASHDFILDNFKRVLKSRKWETLMKIEPVLVAETVTKFAVEDRIRVVGKH